MKPQTPPTANPILGLLSKCPVLLFLYGFLGAPSDYRERCAIDSIVVVLEFRWLKAAGNEILAVGFEECLILHVVVPTK